MGISNGPAALASVLFAFLPYHLWRSTGHLYLSCYFVAAPAVLVAWWVATGRLLDRADGGGAGRVSRWAAAICAVTSIFGACTTRFSRGLILGVASLDRRLWRGGTGGTSWPAWDRWRVLVAAGVLLCLLPTLVVPAHAPPTRARSASGCRAPSEIYGLKITQLLLPPDAESASHRCLPRG